MIQIIEKEECYPQTLEIAITKYINYNLLSIISTLIDFYEQDSEFDIFPLMPLYESRESNLKIIYALRDIIERNSINDYISPKYELTLYIILVWWEEVCDIEENLLPAELDNNLKSIILANSDYIGEEYITSYMDNLCNYDYLYEWCFKDFDFLPENISNLVQLYMRNDENYQLLFSNLELDDYIEVMPQDIREIYLKDKNKVLESYPKVFSEESIIIEIYAILVQMEQRALELKKRSETEISNDMDLGLKRLLKLKHNFEVARERPMGRALVQLGETDIYIYQNSDIGYREIAVIENKFIEKLENEYYQLLGYLNKNFQFGITIAINRNLNYDQAKQKLKEAILKWEKENCGFDIEDIKHPFRDLPDIVMTTHKVPENTNSRMNIYHLILNLSDEFRSGAAIKARAKKSSKGKK